MKRIILSIILIMFFASTIVFVNAQSYTIPTSGSQTITACSGTVYDPGGVNDYSNSCEGTLIINPATSGCRVNLSGSYNTESSFDYFYVYDGTSTSGTQLGYFTGSGTCDVTSTSGSLTIRFHSDGSVVYSGFALTVNCVGSCNCGGPYGVVANTGDHTITISWAAGTGVTSYFVEYGPHGFTPGQGTRVQTNNLSYTFNNLNNGTEYDFYVWFDCNNDNQITTETPTMVSATPNNYFIIPASGNTSVTTCDGQLLDNGGADGDYANSSNGYTVIYPENNTCVVHLDGSFNTESCCDHIYVYDGVGVNGTLLAQYEGTGFVDVSSTTGPLTVKFTSDGSVVRSGFALNISCRGGCDCGGWPYGIMVTQGINGVVLTWSAGLDPDVHHYIIEYGPSGFELGTGTVVIVNDTTYEVMGLTTYATYDFYIWYDCGDDGVVTDEAPALVSFCVPDAVACIDFSDWNNPAIHGTYGTFENPYATAGIVDNGFTSSSSRHTIHYMAEPDPRTGNALMTVPPCELYSVRLGNWSTGSEAESIAYDWLVDTAEADILLLKYAAVLEDPGHDPSEQPRFDFEILDQNGNQIDPTCGFASFIANANLGWNVYNSSVLWKDWTNVGFDVSTYHGQTIRVRLTTYDCDQSGHYGYAYFTLNCKKRTITAETCGEMLSNTYTAPAGFAYSWYYENDPTHILSTDQSCTINVTGGQDILHCHVSFIGNSGCGFDLSTSLTARYPLAQFEPERDGCTYTYRMNNTSTISFDGETPNGSNDPCETAYWDFGDGAVSELYSPEHEFPGPGTYTITLVSGLSQDACLDTTTRQITIPENEPYITGVSSICNGFDTHLTGHGGSYYRWVENGDTIGTEATLLVHPDHTTTYTLFSFGPDSCPVTATQVVTVLEPTSSTITDEVCQNDRYSNYGFNLNPQMIPGDFTHIRVTPNSAGCDSTITLNLTVKPLPNTYLGQDDNHCFEDDGNMMLSVPDGDCDTYLWSNGETNQFISISQGGTYSVTATRDGCTNDYEITIKDVCPINIYLPNCITPSDKDGINDVFQLSSTKDIVEFNIKIYNRWGKLIFYSDDPHFKWNGNVNGKLDLNETYTYAIQYTTVYREKKIISGSITVL